MDPATIAGISISAASVGIGLWGLWKRRESEQHRQEMEQRLERKEALEDLSGELRGLQDRITTLWEDVSDPRSNEDTTLDLFQFVRNMIAYRQSTGENPTVFLSDVSPVRTKDGNPPTFNSASEVVDGYQKSENSNPIQATLHIENADDALRWFSGKAIDNSLRGIFWVRIQLQEIRNSDDELLVQFDDSLLEDIDDALDQLTLACYEQIFDHADGVEFRIDDYESPEELEDDVYETFLLSEKVHEAIDDLEALGERVDKVQTDVAKTSLS